MMVENEAEENRFIQKLSVITVQLVLSTFTAEVSLNDLTSETRDDLIRQQWQEVNVKVTYQATVTSGQCKGHLSGNSDKRSM